MRLKLITKYHSPKQMATYALSVWYRTNDYVCSKTWTKHFYEYSNIIYLKKSLPMVFYRYFSSCEIYKNVPYDY